MSAWLGVFQTSYRPSFESCHPDHSEWPGFLGRSVLWDMRGNATAVHEARKFVAIASIKTCVMFPALDFSALSFLGNVRDCWKGVARPYPLREDANGVGCAPPEGSPAERNEDGLRQAKARLTSGCEEIDA